MQSTGFASDEPSLAESIRAKVTKTGLPKLSPSNDSPENTPIIQPKSPRNEVKAVPSKPSKTVKDIPAIDENQTRRMRLDRDTSYGMKVQRPKADLESGAYKLVAAPSKLDSIEKAEQSRLICNSCGCESETSRLTCPDCGEYFERTVQDTAYEIQKARAKKTIETGAFQQVIEPVTWKVMLAKRLVAKGIDLAIIFSVVAAVVFTFLGWSTNVLVESPELEALFSNITYCVLPGLAILACLIYSASFESSMGQATPGKIATNLSVSDKEGKQLTFSRAFVRALITYFPMILVVVAVWLTKLLDPALASISQDSLWQLSSAALVAGGIGLISYVVSFSTIIQDQDMRTLSDSISGSKVSSQ